MVQATKESRILMQRFYEMVGDTGGTLSVGNGWDLTVEVHDIDGSHKYLAIGVFTVLNGDVAFDPIFRMEGRIEDGRIASLDITSYESTLPFAMLYIDSRGIAHTSNKDGKDTIGLRRRFSDFMDSMGTSPFLEGDRVVIKKYGCRDDNRE